jgi:hypothetical protein
MHHIPYFFTIFIGSVRFWMATSSLIFHVLATLFELFVPHKNTSLFLPHKPRRRVYNCHLHSFLITHKNLMLIRRCKNRPHIFVTRCRNTHVIGATTSTQLTLTRRNRDWCELKHAQTCLHYDQVTWLILSRERKSFRELHSHSVYVCACIIHRVY